MTASKLTLVLVVCIFALFLLYPVTALNDDRVSGKLQATPKRSLGLTNGQCVSAIGDADGVVAGEDGGLPECCGWPVCQIKVCV